MQIEIWSDVICPWCYIGKRRFEQALSAFPARDQVEVVWRSFELDPGAPQQYPGTLDELLANKYGVSAQQAAAMNARVTGIAQEVGLEYRLSQARPGNTFAGETCAGIRLDRGRGAGAAGRRRLRGRGARR